MVEEKYTDLLTHEPFYSLFCVRVKGHQNPGKTLILNSYTESGDDLKLWPSLQNTDSDSGVALSYFMLVGGGGDIFMALLASSTMHLNMLRP